MSRKITAALFTLQFGRNYLGFVHQAHDLSPPRRVIPDGCGVPEALWIGPDMDLTPMDGLWMDLRICRYRGMRKHQATSGSEKERVGLCPEGFRANKDVWSEGRCLGK
jgi:hypothetical protein